MAHLLARVDSILRSLSPAEPVISKDELIQFYDKWTLSPLELRCREDHKVLFGENKLQPPLTSGPKPLSYLRDVWVQYTLDVFTAKQFRPPYRPEAGYIDRCFDFCIKSVPESLYSTGQYGSTMLDSAKTFVQEFVSIVFPGESITYDFGNPGGIKFSVANDPKRYEMQISPYDKFIKLLVTR